VITNHHLHTLNNPSSFSVQVWRPGIDPLGEDEELDYDPTAYDCLHKFALEWPCLSFDIVRDDLGGPRSTFPHTVFMLAGTQVRQRRQQQQQLQGFC
jgi:ribosome assembly protein RRB1